MAGEYARILTPMFFVQFVVSPISQVAVIAERQRIDLVWQISLFILISVVFAIGRAFDDLRLTLILFSGAYSVMYTVAGIVNYKLSQGKGFQGVEKGA